MMYTLDDPHERMMAHLGRMEATDLEANPEEIQSEAEHREVHEEHATVETGRALNQQHGDQNLFTEHCCKLKDGS
jgi:hypothetical protein